MIAGEVIYLTAPCDKALCESARETERQGENVAAADARLEAELNDLFKI